MPHPPFLKADNIATCESAVSHGFFGRHGGVSDGIYGSLNTGVGSDDAPAAVAENRSRITNALGIDDVKLATLFQIHSAQVVHLTSVEDYDLRPKADAMVTRLPKLALGILTADCVPVLFVDAQAGVIGAAHAGWRSALNGVLANTLNAMCDIGAHKEHIHAAIGPCIHQPSYEMGPEVHAEFCTSNQVYNQYFQPNQQNPKTGRPATYQFDLPGFVACKLDESGIKNIDLINADTYALTNDFFSYRRACHRDEADYGRQLSVIALR